MDKPCSVCSSGGGFQYNYNTADCKVYLADARRANDDDLCVVHVQHRRSGVQEHIWTTPVAGRCQPWSRRGALSMLSNYQRLTDSESLRLLQGFPGGRRRKLSRSSQEYWPQMDALYIPRNYGMQYTSIFPNILLLQQLRRLSKFQKQHERNAENY